MLVTKEEVAVTSVVEPFPAGLVSVDLGSGLKAQTLSAGRASIHRACEFIDSTQKASIVA